MQKLSSVLTGWLYCFAPARHVLNEPLHGEIVVKSSSSSPTMESSVVHLPLLIWVSKLGAVKARYWFYYFATISEMQAGNDLACVVVKGTWSVTPDRKTWGLLFILKILQCVLSCPLHSWNLNLWCFLKGAALPCMLFAFNTTRRAGFFSDRMVRAIIKNGSDKCVLAWLHVLDWSVCYGVKVGA